MLVTDSGMVTLVKVEHFANVNCRHTRGYKCQLKDLVPVVMTASPCKSVCARQLGGWFVAVPDINQIVVKLLFVFLSARDRFCALALRRVKE